jgi:DNA-binding transcriptional MerR regulator
MSDNFTSRTSWLAGELAQAVGVSTDTLRHYERKGVLSATRMANGYRRYSETAFERVLLVRRALRIGFTLDELAQILSEYDGGGAPCRKVRAMAKEKLANVEAELNALTALRDELAKVVCDWDTRIAATPANGRAGLLRTLGSNDSAGGADSAGNRKAKLPLPTKLKKRTSER